MKLLCFQLLPKGYWVDNLRTTCIPRSENPFQVTIWIYVSFSIFNSSANKLAQAMKKFILANKGEKPK